MNGWAADLVGQEIADKVGKVWGLGSDTDQGPRPVGGRAAQHVEAHPAGGAVVPRRQPAPVAPLLALPRAAAQGAGGGHPDARSTGCRRCTTRRRFATTRAGRPSSQGWNDRAGPCNSRKVQEEPHRIGEPDPGPPSSTHTCTSRPRPLYLHDCDADGADSDYRCGSGVQARRDPGGGDAGDGEAATDSSATRWWSSRVPGTHADFPDEAFVDAGRDHRRRLEGRRRVRGQRAVGGRAGPACGRGDAGRAACSPMLNPELVEVSGVAGRSRRWRWTRSRGSRGRSRWTC